MSSSRWPSVGTSETTQRTARCSNSSSIARCQASSWESTLPCRTSWYRRRVLAVSAPRSTSTSPSGERYSLSGAVSFSALPRARPRLPIALRLGRSPLELGTHVAGHRVGVPGPRGRRLERGELADRGPRLLGVVVERLVGHAWRAVAAGLGIERVEAVADQRQAVRGAPQAD